MSKKILVVTGDAGESYEALYAVHRFLEAGWEPVTLAHSSDSRVYVERFGEQLFTVFNDSPERRTVTIKLDRETPKSSRELITGQTVEWRNQQASLTLEGEGVAVIKMP